MFFSRSRVQGISFSLALCLTALPAVCAPASAAAQAAAAPAHAAPQRGTVKSIDGSTLTMTTDAGQQVTVTVAPGARVQRLAPGTTDLKTAEPAALTDVAVGDRVLVAGAAGDTPAAFTASRVILMKSGDIAQKHEAEQQDWQRHGTGGIVSAVDATAGTITISSGTRKVQLATTSTTIFRRYAGGSVRFEDAKPGVLAQIQPGDQLLARGAKEADGASVDAVEVVSGSFKNISGTVLSIDATANTVTVKDLVTKRPVVVHLTPGSALHRLPSEVATRFAARARSTPADAAARPATPAAAPAPTGEAAAAEHTHGQGGDLSQVVAHLPPTTLADLHVGDAVLIVGELSSGDASSLTVVSLLAGVEPILAAAPSGSSALTLSPWNVGGGSPESGAQ